MSGLRLSNEDLKNINNVNVTTPQFKANEKSKTVNNSENEGMSNAAKFAIGATALAGIVIAGLALKGKFSTKIVEEEVNKLKIDTSKIEDIVPDSKILEKSKNAGKTVEETIKNILGKDTKVTPHNYDVSKEFDTIPIYRNSAGYKDGWATTKGCIPHMYNTGITESTIREVAISDGMQNAKNTIHLSKNGIRVYSGTADKYENKIVRLEIDDKFSDSRNTGTSIRFAFISPNKDFTPLQKDILKLAEHPEKIDLDALNIITKFRKGNLPNGKVDFENANKYENLDYDLFLSVIQSMAKSIV